MQESVWDYPRPPRLEPSSKQITVVYAGVQIAETIRAYRVLETSHPPTYYIPPDDINLEYLRSGSDNSYCEWKGKADYYDVVVSASVAQRAAWTYHRPTPGFEQIAGFLSFYAESMERCTVDGEIVTPQPGNFYGGWITSDISGPFKGGPGTSGW